MRKQRQNRATGSRKSLYDERTEGTMKKIVFMVMVFLMAATVAFAYRGDYMASDLATIRNHPVDNQRVILEGSLVRQVGHEDYIFQDKTGEIAMEVDDDVLAGFGDPLHVAIRVYGKVDIDHQMLEIEAKRIERL